MHVIKKIKKNINIRFSNYFSDYWYIHESKNMNGLQLLDFQYYVNDIINNCLFNYEFINKKIVNYKGNDRKIKELRSILNRIDYLVKLYRCLIDDIIIIYICEGDVALFAQLIDYRQRYPNYNYHDIKTYYNVAKFNYLGDNDYVVISDLSSHAIKTGDLLFYSLDSGFDYTELKSGAKTIDLFGAIIPTIKYAKLNKTDQEQSIRINKQLIKHAKFDDWYMFPMFCGDYRFFDVNFCGDTFFNQIINDINKLNYESIIENKVDNNISYVVYSKKNEKKIFNFLINNGYIRNDINVFDYTSFLLNSDISRPFYNNWDKKTYKRIVIGELIIIIKINIMGVLNCIKSKTPDLIIRRAVGKEKIDYKYFIIDGMLAYYDKTTQNKPFYLNLFVIFYIVTRFFTSEEVAYYYYQNLFAYNILSF